MSYERVGMGESIPMPASGRCPEGMERSLIQGTYSVDEICVTPFVPTGSGGSALDAIRKNILGSRTTGSGLVVSTTRPTSTKSPTTTARPTSTMASQRAQYEAQRQIELARRLANPATTPIGSACGGGGITRSYSPRECPPWVMCSTQIGPPRGCVDTGKWYNESSKELCCPQTSIEPGSGDAAILAEMQRRRAMEQAALMQQQTGRHNTLLLLGLGAIGIGLFMVLRKK